MKFYFYSFSFNGTGVFGNDVMESEDGLFDNEYNDVTVLNFFEISEEQYDKFY